MAISWSAPTFNFRSVVPMLDAEVRINQASRRVNFIVDTGSTYTIIQLPQVASLLDVIPDRRDLVQVGGIAADLSGNPLMGFSTSVTIEIAPGCSYVEPEAWISPNVHWSVLGTHSFFRNHGFCVWNWENNSRFKVFQRAN